MKAVNLLPTDLRTADRKAGAGAAPQREGAGGLAVLGALALVALAVVATVLAGNSVKANQRELATVQADQQAAQRTLTALAPYGTFQQLATKRVQTVRDLAAARFDWEQALRDLSRAVPSDVTLEGITGTVTAGATATGGSSNPLRGSIQAPAIELSGCTADQVAVARLMARLRAVQGVTRVSLSSSQKQDSAPVSAAPTSAAPTTAPAPASSSAAVKPKGCGAGARPKFELVMFFEGATAAASTTTPAAPAGAATQAASAPSTPAPGATPDPAATTAPGQPAAAPTPAPATGQATTQGASTP